MTDYQLRRLGAADAGAISDCFQRVYSDSYANELFYDVERLAMALSRDQLNSVGAFDDGGLLVAHMAMVRHPQARFAELGNTIVDPSARGAGLAWRVGAELTAWCRELGYPAYLHYPTADHHIMQRQSVKAGSETGLMLGYIPAEVDGQVSGSRGELRGAATIVVNPLAPCPTANLMVPRRYLGLLQRLVAESGLARTLTPAPPLSLPPAGSAQEVVLAKRGLCRLEVTRAGADLSGYLSRRRHPCEFVDFAMSDPGIDAAVELACAHGFVFCGWLPGYRNSDVLRLQRFDVAATTLEPNLVNPVGQWLLQTIRAELS